MMIKNSIRPTHFEKLTERYQAAILSWLYEPHMQEFWDNSQEHKDDIINFINGRVTPSNYFGGIFTYWVGIIETEPFCLILTAKVNREDDVPKIWKENIPQIGTTYCIDFGIGNKNFLGKKLAALTLKFFTEFFKKNIDPSVSAFLIDPAEDNPRATHVYEKAGFKKVGNFEMEQGYFKGEQTHLMVMKL